ncbi:mannose-6-phosphate isomerase, class I [Planomicrobium okeanokoites]|uniref:mannose-6-phosphate isomerase, class I n=1 Tax=Planomicrobium okeanokoites TaxID=244 RepID=UPI002490BFF7|nr:mannose-6-phosphate isomerase, class I [Planomicrobium okeanokoites]
MYKEPIFFEPIFQERIWGGTSLQELYGFKIPNETTGEAWVISAHENGPSIVKNGSLKGKNLLEVWNDYPHLFGEKTTTKEFPLLIKILDANDNLSVQVHPDDKYARSHEGEKYGKTECWYILDCEEDAEIIFGHMADSEDEFRRKVKAGKWDDLLQRVKVKKGDFVYVPSGTIHAIGKGIIILETQQSSDITYRVYDFDRTDNEGNKRELHIEQAINVTSYPHNVHAQDKVEKTIGNLFSTQLIAEKYFTVYHWQLDGKTETPLYKDYLLMSVIEGKGKIVIEEKEYELNKGDSFIIPSTVSEYVLNGTVEIIVSHT